MNKRPLMVLLAVLILLAVGGGALYEWGNQSWQQEDQRIGQKTLAGFVPANVAEIALRSAQEELHVVKSGNGWVLRERADFPADLNRIAALLAKLADIKVVQTEALASDSERSRLLLVEPKAAATEAGTSLELKDAAGKPLGRLLLGKKVTKKTTQPDPQTGQPKEVEVAVGRYLVAGSDANIAQVVSDGLEEAVAAAPLWEVKPVLQLDRVKSMTVTQADGRPRWMLTRATPGDVFLFGGGGSERPDPQKAQDRISAIYAISQNDVIAKPDPVATGLDKPLTVKIDTFDNLSYTFKIGGKVGTGYAFTFTSSGEPPLTRPLVKDEKPEERQKKEKEYLDLRVKWMEQLTRERNLEKWTYEVPKMTIEPLLVERSQLLSDKKPVRK